MIKRKTSYYVCEVVLTGLTLILYLIGCIMDLAGATLGRLSVHFVILAILALNFLILHDILRQTRRHFAFLVFLASFNLLLLGRVYVNWFSRDILRVLEADSFHNLFFALQLIYISLLVVYLTYRASAPIFAKREQALNAHGRLALSQNPVIPIIRQLSLVVFFLSSIAFFYSLITNVVYIIQAGYLNSFMSHAEIPRIINIISTLFFPSFVVFLATIPSKKQLCIPMIIYLIYMVLSLFTGRRNTMVRELLMLLIYFVLRDDLLEKGKRLFNKITVGIVAFFSVAFAYIMQIFAYVRTDVANADTSFFGGLVSFLDSQGATFRVVVQTINQYARIDHSMGLHYLFYPVELFFHNNVFGTTLFGTTPIVETQTEQYVRTTHNFGHVITYMVNPDRYLSGGGFGTAYIAEGYVAFGIIGVIMVSIMVGLAFRFFSSLLSRSWLGIALGLIAIRYFVYIPRNFTLGWVPEVFNITYLIYLSCIYLAALLLLKVGTHVRTVKSSAPAKGS